MEIFSNGDWLPVVFVGLMGLAIMIYVILDGYDLGVGVLMGRASSEDRDKMISSIGPFWDANETWLVLSVGLLLVAFPIAHGEILSALYLPTALMLLGLILRGVSFDFRVRSKPEHRKTWCNNFVIGSILTSFMQGFMLGSYITGFKYDLFNFAFCILSGLCLIAGYSLVGASWLIMKTQGALQKRAISWAKTSLVGTTTGMILVSSATPMISDRIFSKWFVLPNFYYLLPIPLITACTILYIEYTLRRLPMPKEEKVWVPFVGSVVLFSLGFFGLAISFFPYIIPERMTIWEAASAHESLLLILYGTILVLPFILGYTFFVYRIFWGKVSSKDEHH
jgi:cytochrome d ubiquinol oxidase subunit II